MSITTGSIILASDFIATSAGAGDSGKVPKLNGSGKLDTSFLPTLGTFAFGNTSHDASLTTSTVIAHGLGVTPKRIRVAGAQGSGSSPAGLLSIAEAIGTSGNMQYLNSYFLGNGSTGSGNSFIFYNGSNTANYISGTVTVDATNITISWSKTTSSGTVYLTWEAQA